MLSAATAVLLSLPGFRFAYLFDDYDFLGRTQLFRADQLVPDAGVVLYRPISRELYFGLLNWLSPGNPLAGHIINAALLAAVAFLGSFLAVRLAGSRAALISGLLLATFGQCPVLVAWVSGAQDLFAMCFALLALHLELSGRSATSLVAFACAILSKETAVAAVPALVAVHWRRLRTARAMVPGVLRIGALIAAWALIHPGIRILLNRGHAARDGSYFSLDTPDRWISLLKSIPTLLNVPLRLPTSWPPGMTYGIALALIPFLAALWALRVRSEQAIPRSDGEPMFSRRQAAGLGILLGVPPLLLTCFLVRVWAPYYLCFPMLGISIALGSWLSTSPRRWTAALLVLFFALGVWSRGVEFKAGALTEQGLTPAAMALPVVERNFKRLMPSLPRSAVVYVTTKATGSQSVYRHIHHFQALRVWYRDPTIQTLRPELHVLSSSPEFLFVIDPQLNVFQIDVQTLAVRSSGGPVNGSHYRSALLSYAIGLAGVGEVDRAVTILLGMDVRNAPNEGVNRRTAAMLLFSQGDNVAANNLLRGLPDLPPSDAFENVGMILTVPTGVTALEVPALRAFGFSPEDPTVLRPLLRALLSLGHYEVSRRLAQRLLVVQPGEPEAVAALARIDSLTIALDQVTREARKLDFSGK